jgi:DNA-binding beta-propeller fold protein YncE
MRIKTVLIATVVTFALILMGSLNGNALGSTQQDNNRYSLVAIWGTEGTGDGEFAEPHGVAVDSSDNVYVTDRDNCKVEKLTADGNFIRKWGSLGRDDGEFIDPHGIDFDSSDNVYIVDSQNERIQKFDSDGNFITKWGSEGYGDGQFWLPHDIAIDSSDNVYVVDSGNVHEKKDVCAL